jgi:DNA-binding IclR family transcriptional regulator
MSEDDGATSVTQKPLLVLGKITEILDAFSLSRPSMTLGEIQHATGLPTSTVQRLVTNMVAQGLLDRTGDQIRIGVKLAYWAAPAVKGVDVLTIVNPVLRELRDTTGETACFFREEQGYRVCVAVAETRHALRRDMYVGKILPLHAGSAGRVLLAWDDDLADRVLSRPLEPITGTTITSPERLRELIGQTRKDGFAITTAEREDGSSGLSAPVFDSATELIGALAISGPTIRMPLARCEQWLDLLVACAEKLTRTLGGRYPV